MTAAIFTVNNPSSCEGEHWRWQRLPCLSNSERTHAHARTHTHSVWQGWRLADRRQDSPGVFALDGKGRDSFWRAAAWQRGAPGNQG